MKSSSGKRSNRDPPSQMFGDVLEWRTLRIYTTSPATMAQATNTLITIPAMAPPLRPEVPLCPGGGGGQEVATVLATVVQAEGLGWGTPLCSPPPCLQTRGRSR